MTLTSPQNSLLQKVRRSVSAGRPTEDGLIAAEGPHLLSEALDSRWRVEHVFCSSEARLRHQALLSKSQKYAVEITEVADRAFKGLSDTEHTQGIVTLVRPRIYTFRELLALPGPFVVLDCIQDPGNAGAILRSTEAFGGSGVLFTEGCIRISNGKLLRAAAGSLFRLPIIENVSAAEVIRQAGSSRTIFSLAAHGEASLSTIEFEKSFALIVGNEGSGISKAFQNASQTLSIPTVQVESLNAAIACSIALYEAARQRRLKL